MKPETSILKALTEYKNRLTIYEMVFCTTLFYSLLEAMRKGDISPSDLLADAAAIATGQHDASAGNPGIEKAVEWSLRGGLTPVEKYAKWAMRGGLTPIIPESVVDKVYDLPGKIGGKKK